MNDSARLTSDDESVDAAYSRPCPECGAATGRPCRMSAEPGRPVLDWPHGVRRQAGPVVILAIDWSRLAQPTYAVSRDGEARRLPAGTYLAPLAADERDGRLPVLEVQMWTEPEWPYYERPVSFWFVHGPALRFEEGA